MNDPADGSRDDTAAALRRLGVAGVDDAFLARAQEVAAGTREHLARIPTQFGKDAEPAHVFSVPLR